MEKLRIVIVVMLAAALSACKPTPKEAGAFNNDLMAQQKAVVVKYDQLLETFDTYVSEKMDAALVVLMDQVAESQANVQELTPIVGGENLKQEVLNYISVFEDVTNNDLDYLVRLYKLPENEFTAEVRLQWETRYKDVDTRIKEASARLKEAQKEYANYFNLDIK